MENDIVTIQIDPMGQGEEITRCVNKLSLEMSSAEDRHLHGANLLNITGNVASIISLINMLTADLSKEMMICLSIGGVVVWVAASKAVELLQKKASAKE